MSAMLTLDVSYEAHQAAMAFSSSWAAMFRLWGTKLRDRCIVEGVPVGNSILLATDIESGDAPALCERSVA
jgi:hypothetical protein